MFDTILRVMCFKFVGRMRKRLTPWFDTRSGGRVDATVAERTYGFTPLHEAVIGGQIEVVKWLCDKCDAGGDVNIPNKMGTSPLMNACHVGNLRMAKVEFVQKHKPLFIFFLVWQNHIFESTEHTSVEQNCPPPLL